MSNVVTRWRLYHYFVFISASSHQVAAVVEVVLVSSVVTRWRFYHYYVCVFQLPLTRWPRPWRWCCLSILRVYFSFLSPGGRGGGGGISVQYGHQVAFLSLLRVYFSFLSPGGRGRGGGISSSVVTRWCFYHYYVLYFSFLSPGGRGRGGGVGVQRSPSAIKEMLLNWCRAMTKEYDVCHVMPTDQILY